MANRADRVITCSHYMRDHVADVYGLDEARITVIPNGIDPLDLQPVDDLERAARALRRAGRAARAAGRPAGLREGLPARARGAARADRAARGRALPRRRLGHPRAGAARAGRRLGLDAHGTFLGWIGDDVLHSLYRIADLCVVPSLYEPFGLVALEAMASGCPCIVADTGGLREVVPEDERVGLRFNGARPEPSRRWSSALLTDDALRERLVAEASEHVLRFDWADVARQTAAIYDELRRAAV